MDILISTEERTKSSEMLDYTPEEASEIKLSNDLLEDEVRAQLDI